jgi:predicted transcriptional regulator
LDCLSTLKKGENVAKHLTEKDREFRRLVQEHDGDQRALADLLGVSVSAVSARLTTEKHGAWWRTFKKKRARERKRARQARWRQGVRERAGAKPLV